MEAKSYLGQDLDLSGCKDTSLPPAGSNDREWSATLDWQRGNRRTGLFPFWISDHPAPGGNQRRRALISCLRDLIWFNTLPMPPSIGPHRLCGRPEQFELTLMNQHPPKFLPNPPAAEKRPVRDLHHGIERIDDYAWLRAD